MGGVMAQGSHDNPLSAAVDKVKNLISGDDGEDTRSAPAVEPSPSEAPASAAYQDLTVDELRDLAGERHITGRWEMSRDELIVTLAGDWESYDQLTVEELRDLARKRGIEGRSDMDKEELIEVLSLEARSG
jgi:hypothetical protein